MPGSNAAVLEQMNGLFGNDHVGRSVTVDSESRKRLILKEKNEGYPRLVTPEQQEGVAEEGSYQLKEANPGATSLTAVYQGKLTREVIAMIAKDVMTQRGLSLRGAVAKTGFSKSMVHKVRTGTATIDRGLDFLEALDCELETHVAIPKSTIPEPEMK